MKPCRWLLTLLALLLVVGPYTPAQADWVDVSDQFTIFINELAADPPPSIDVAVTNFTTDYIEGELRLIFIPAEGTPLPVNAETAGEDGSNPKSYFSIVGAQEGVIEPGEVVHVSMEFDDTFTDGMEFTLAVEVNDASLDNQIFRKKISKTPEFYSGEGGIAVMPVYVTAQNTSGEKYTRADTGELVLCGTTCDENGANCETILCSEDDYAKVKPLIVTYVQEEEVAPFNSVPDYDGNGDGIYDDGDRYAHDIYAAVSLDDGLTWKRRNISRTSLKSSFTLPNGVEYPGDSEDADLTVVGPYAFVTWTDKYCRSGDPWDIAESGEVDIYQVTGSQKSVDYVDVKGDEDPRPDLGVRPFSCLWGARGVLDMETETADKEPNPNYGTIVWYKAEQLSTGRRDAKRNFNAGIEPVSDPTYHQPVEGTGGFAVSWQEDPKGLKTGKGRGPGAGMSGACVNHKTDIWYSYISWSDFATIDANFVSNSDGDAIQDGDGEPGSEYFCTVCPYVYDPEIGDPDNGVSAGTAFVDLHEEWVCPLCGAAKDTFEKDAKPHALIHFKPPVRVTDNAVCRERNPTEIMGHVHTADHIAATGCDYYYEGGTTNQPLAWDDLPDEWECPKCGGTKDTFEAEATFIKYRNEGAPYCESFATNPRVDGDGNLVSPEDVAYEVAYYTQPLFDSEGNQLVDDSGNLVFEPLDGNTGASRANLSLVNWMGETLALMAYEETKGVGAGSDKEAAAMEQAAPYPLVLEDGRWEAGATNSDCRSCHYENVVPRNRYIPMATEADCLAKGGTWDPDLKAYYPYTGYPLITDDPLDALPEDVSTINPMSPTGDARCVPCIKFKAGWGMYPRDYARIYGDNTYYNLPDHMPGWHQAALDCTGCHLPYNTKDHDQDTVVDRADQCLETPLGEAVVLDSTSPNYGCSASQDPNAADNNKDEPDRFRHGKNLYYHHFAFNDPESAAIGHGDQVNGYSRDVLGQDEDGNPILWSAPDTYDPYENARRVRVVPNADLSAYETSGSTPDVDVITLGLLYKEGKDGQGAPADAMLSLFKGGFDIENMGAPLNLSSSTPYLFEDPDEAGNEEGSGDNPAGDGTGDMLPNRNTPKIGHFYWTDANLQDPTGYWYKDENGENEFYSNSDGTVGYTPIISGNPFENVFSTRLAIHGDLVVAGYAYCVNWSAGKKAKDHYDFYIRVSDDAGENWTLPVNVSNLKNHEESVSDCRVILTPPTLDDWDIYDSPFGQRIPFSMTGAPAVEATGDFNRMGTFFVGVGTKENIPQPSPNEIELEESEVFLDTFYSQGEIAGGLITFETYTKENPKYVEGSLPYLDLDGVETDASCWEGNEADGTCVPNEPNPAFPMLVEEFNWLAKGDANQGDIQMACNPYGSRLYTIWEQELAITDEDGQNHFQGADVWFRKVFYEEPVADMDVNEDGEVNWVDGRDILRAIGSTAYDADFLWRGDFFADHRITGRDFSLWKREFTKLKISQLRSRWTSR